MERTVAPQRLSHHREIWGKLRVHFRRRVEVHRLLSGWRDRKSCSRTRLLQGADEDLTELGKRDGGAWGPASLPGSKGSSQSPELTQPSSTKGVPTVGGGCAAPLRPGHATGDLALLGLLAGLVAVGHRQRCQGRRNVGPSGCRSSGEMSSANGQESVPRASVARAREGVQGSDSSPAYTSARSGMRHSPGSATAGTTPLPGLQMFPTRHRSPQTQS